MYVKMTGFKEMKIAMLDNMKLTAVKKLVKLNGSEMQQKAQRFAPVDTGQLKRSISLEIKDNGMTAEVSARTNYAAYQEYGTRYMRAQPYMGPAFRQQSVQFRHDLDNLTN